MVFENLSLPRRDDLRAMVRLAVPVVAVQLGLMAMGVVDTVIVGHVSPQALAAVALGNVFVLSVGAFGVGVLMALDPLVAQSVGTGDMPAVVRHVQRAMVLSLALAIPTSLILLPGETVLRLLGQPEEIVPLAASYARIRIPGVLAYYLFVALRQTLQAKEQVRPIVVTIVVANVINAVLDWALVFGKLGMAELGALGSAWATTASRWLLVLGLLLVARRELLPLLRRFETQVLNLVTLGRMVRLGAPIGGHMMLEYMAFAVIALLMGKLGTIEMAAHQVALNLAALTYMVPLGVSAAVAVRVGHAVGRDSRSETQRAAGAGLFCGGAFMAACALVFVTAPGLLAAGFTDASEVRLLAAALIPIAGFFQVFDGLQVVSAGVLRGLGDTRAPLLVGILGFWLIGLPVSLLLCFHLGWGARGLWWGFVAGLGVVAVFLLGRVAILLSRGVARVEID
jgi:MATE family multidrug resistance protein